MKKQLLLAVAVAMAASVNAQTILGTHSNDSVLLRANSGSNLSVNNRIKLRAEGQVTFHDANPAFNNQGGTAYASVSIAKRSLDSIGVLISDNSTAWLKPAKLAIVNYNNTHALYINNERYNSSNTVTQDKGIVSTGGNAGYFRLNMNNFNNLTYYGYRCHNSTENPSNSNVNYISYSSGGLNSYNFNSLTDYHAAGIGFNGRGNTRYGFYADFDSTHLGMANAWGFYQPYNSIRNHFNGTTLFGSTTDNTYDKVQVTGGTKTDGFAAGIRTETGNYPAINTDYTILVNAASATITLPTTGIPNGKIYCIKNINSTPGVVTIETDAPSTNKIDGSNSKTLNLQYESMMVQFNGTHYFVLATH